MYEEMLRQTKDVISALEAHTADLLDDGFSRPVIAHAFIHMVWSLCEKLGPPETARSYIHQMAATFHNSKEMPDSEQSPLGSALSEMTAAQVPHINAVQELMKPRLQAMVEAKCSAPAIGTGLMELAWTMATVRDRPEVVRDWMCDLADAFAAGPEECRP